MTDHKGNICAYHYQFNIPSFDTIGYTELSYSLVVIGQSACESKYANEELTVYIKNIIHG